MAFNLKSALSPDGGTMVGLLTAVGVYLIYNNALPSAADVRTAQPGDSDVSASRKQAAWESAGLIGLVFLVSKDLNSYVISGAALVAVDLMYKHANMTNPQTGQLDTSTSGVSVAPNLTSLSDYGDESVAS